MSDITLLKREYYATSLGLSETEAAVMSINDLEFAFFSNPPSGGGGTNDVRYPVIVEHGAVASVARPSGATLVQWIGSVEPLNAVSPDEWLNPSEIPTVFLQEPAVEGTVGWVLTTDGAGTRTWAALPAGGSGLYPPVDPTLYLPAVDSGLGVEELFSFSEASRFIYTPTWVSPGPFQITSLRLNFTAIGTGTLKFRIGLIEMSTLDVPTTVAHDFGEVTIASTGVFELTGLTTDVDANKAYCFALWRTSGASTVTFYGNPVSYGSLGKSTSISNRVIHARSRAVVTIAGAFPGTLPLVDTYHTPSANSKAGPLEFILVKRTAL